MIKIYADKSKLKFSGEIAILGGLLKQLPDEPEHNYNKKGESRFGNLIDFCNQNITYVDDIKDADLCVLPYKFKGVEDPYLAELTKSGRNIYCFYDDDDDKSYPLEHNVFLYRTSMYRSLKSENEKCLPALATDRFEGNIIKKPELSIGFVGQAIPYRYKYIKALKRSKLTTNIIIRKSHWAPEVDKKTAVKEFFDNIRDNIFIFCCRGDGNYSYRFYETLMMGRIPILIDTDSPLPFEDKIKYQDHLVLIHESEIKSPRDIIKYITDFYTEKETILEEIQHKNRELWEKYFSATGFVDQFIKEFKAI